MKIRWSRILRTALQVAAGAGVSLLSALQNNYNNKEAIITALITFIVTVATAFLMNLKNELEEKE